MDLEITTGPAGNGMDVEVFTIGSFDDGSGPTLWVGGIFTTAGGIPSRFIARWGSATNVFAGGFETGDFAGWSRVVGSPS